MDAGIGWGLPWGDGFWGPFPSRRKGMARPVHLLPPGTRRVELIVKVAAIAVVDAQETEQHGVRLERTEALVPAT